jgi:hypothetical protein
MNQLKNCTEIIDTVVYCQNSPLACLASVDAKFQVQMQKILGQSISRLRPKNSLSKLTVFKKNSNLMRDTDKGPRAFKSA